MISDANIFALLSELGLVPGDAELYLAILVQSQEPLGGLRLGRLSNPSDPSLRRLCDHGLVLLSQAADGETVAIALDPKLASRAIYARHLWTMCPDESAASQLLPAVIDDLRAYRAVCTKLEAALLEHYRQPAPEQGVVLVRGDMISQKLALVIASARATIHGITVPVWAPRLDLVWEALKERMSAGVRYRRLSDETTFIAFGYQINVRDTHAFGVDLRVLPRNQIREKFFLCDGKCAFTFWPAQPGAAFPLDASVTYLDVLVRSCEQTFTQMWDRAIPGSQAIEAIGPLRGPFVQECMAQRSSESMAELANGLFDWGKFFFDDCTAKERDRFKQDFELLRTSGLVIPSPDDPTAAIPNLIDELRAALQRNSKQNE